MFNLPLGSIVLLIVGLVIYFGLAQRILDRLRLTDKEALGVIGLMIVGSYVDIPLWKGSVKVVVNLGGGIIPLVLAVYLLIKADTTWEKVRSIIAVLLTAAIIYYLGSVLSHGNPREMIIDPLYMFPLVGGTIAYLLGRSRRGSFVAATMGLLAQDVINYFWLLNHQVQGKVFIGGAGAFDGIVIAGILAVLLAEFIGEVRERLQGGPASPEGGGGSTER